MKRIQKLLLWFAMLSKRLYKKPTFVVLLALIPVLTLGYTAISSGDSGLLTIGLACQAEDPITEAIFTELQSESELLAFQICTDPQEAETLLRAGKLDAAWIFPGDMAEKIEKFTTQPTSSNAFIQVMVREDSVAMMLSREKLSGSVYPYVAQRVYVHFLRDLAPELSHLSDEQLLEYYWATDLSINLFEFENATPQQKPITYLLSPLRGLLGTLILLCSLASAMYYFRDMENGTFAWVSQRWQFLPELGCQLTASLHIAAICMICLSICGLAGNLWTELIILILYSLCCSLFAMALRQICGSLKLLSAALPLVIIAVLVICPVFLDLGMLHRLQYLLPPTYYINAAYNNQNLLHMAGYIGAAAAITLLVQYVKRIFRH